jgi:hypothetical protein
VVQQCQNVISPTLTIPFPFQIPCGVSVLKCLSREISLSEREARARLHRLALVDRSVKHKARVHRQKDEFKARLRAAERERQSQKSSKDKRDSCLCLCSFIVVVLVLNVHLLAILAHKTALRQGRRCRRQNG